MNKKNYHQKCNIKNSSSVQEQGRYYKEKEAPGFVANKLFYFPTVGINIINKIHLHIINYFNLYRFILPLIIYLVFIYFFNLNVVYADDDVRPNIQMVIDGQAVGIDPDRRYNIPLDGWIECRENVFINYNLSSQSQKEHLHQMYAEYKAREEELKAYVKPLEIKLSLKTQEELKAYVKSLETELSLKTQEQIELSLKAPEPIEFFFKTPEPIELLLNTPEQITAFMFDTHEAIYERIVNKNQDITEELVKNSTKTILALSKDVWACKTKEELENKSSSAAQIVNHILGFLSASKNNENLTPIYESIFKHMYCYLTTNSVMNALQSTDVELYNLLYQKRMSDFPQVLEQ